ncbi:Hypothetical Protein OBI_RACECAR_226 [Arthrobacter phage Racecar]|nr:hypothetical protein PBI_RACECAR_18 [Arthrobacter phage Racecar]QFG12702.1 hypothetical protein PBI_MIMI_18 [Arthrobacter phage Mimi]
MSNVSYKVAQMLEEIAGRRGDRAVTGIPTATNMDDAEKIDKLYQEEIERQLKPLRREIAAIKRREETYFNHGALEEMVPWFDLSGEERESALAYFGDDND